LLSTVILSSVTYRGQLWWWYSSWKYYH
jgi:hypothetical protein